MQNNQLTYFPKSYTNRAIICYGACLLAVSFIYSQYALPWYLMAFGIVSVLMFFWGANSLTKKWHETKVSPKTFVKRAFWTAAIIRLVYALFIVWYNNTMYGQDYEFGLSDIGFYVSMAQDLATSITNGQWGAIRSLLDEIGFSDSGYIIYLSFVYVLTGLSSITIIPVLIKSLMGAYTCICVYRIAQRHFGDSVARIACIFCILQTNMIWWCGSMMKETEMLFAFFAYMNAADELLSKGNFKFKDFPKVIVWGGILFMFRTALGLVAFIALAMAIVFISNRIVSFGKKILLGVFLLAVIGVAVGNRLTEEAKYILSVGNTVSTMQQQNMEWRAKRDGGNSFAKYASTTVFAPMIFTIPFPTMVYVQESQQNQMQLAGGNFIKNILSFFVIFVMFYFLLTGTWRQHIFPIVLLLGYLAVLTLSNFAHSGRFHMPAYPLEMMFAAYGITILPPKWKKFFPLVLVLEVVVCVVWSWFKLKGRGM